VKQQWKALLFSSLASVAGILLAVGGTDASLRPKFDDGKLAEHSWKRDKACQQVMSI